MPYKDPEKQREARKRYYEKNKELVKQRSKKTNHATRETVRRWLFEHLKANPCMDCGETDPIVLEFDHQRDKKFAIGSASSKGVALNTLIAEVAKCEVRCANCHRRKTYHEAGRKHRG